MISPAVPPALAFFAGLPRGHAVRVAEGRRIRRIHAAVIAPIIAERWAALVRASVWSAPDAIGCVETGELFRAAWAAAKPLGVSAVSVSRAARSGVRVAGVRFVLLNGPRWGEGDVWKSPDAVGCAETGELFATPGFAASFYRVNHWGIFASADRGVVVRKRGLHFVWLDARRRPGAVRGEQRKECAA